MTASIQKQESNKEKVKKNAINYDKTQHEYFREKPLLQATKQDLNSS